MSKDRLYEVVSEQTNPRFAAVWCENLYKNYEQLKTSAELKNELTDILQKNKGAVHLLTTIMTVKEKKAAQGNDDFAHKNLYNRAEDVVEITLPKILRMADKARSAQDIVMEKIMSGIAEDPMDIPEGSAIMFDEKGYGYALMLVDNESELSPDKSPEQVYAELKERCAHPDEFQNFLQGIHDAGRASALAVELYGENATSRDKSDDKKVAELCYDFPRIALVAIVQGGKDIDSSEKLEKAINNPKNVHLARELDLEYQTDSKQHNLPVDDRYKSQLKAKIGKNYIQTIQQRVKSLLK